MIDFKTASLEEVLNHKTMYYDKIDFSFVKKSWDIISSKIELPFVIHIVGTNGKGSTGRFLSSYLVKKSFKTLHYSSPHILKFNERIWINGIDSSNKELDFSHKKLQEYLPIELLEKLTYFEYTTLLALILSDGLDYLVLEAGLGGEFDATNVVPNDISLITTIGLDHQKFLGSSVEDIAITKMRSVDTKMIIGFQVYDEVITSAREVQKQLKNEFYKDIKVQKVENFEKYKFMNSIPKYLKKNLHLVTTCLEELSIEVEEHLFEDIKLFGRCEKIRDNITIDVGHNPLAAEALVKEFEGKNIHLIYNSYEDKDYEEVLKILKPIIKKITILDIDDKRMVNKNNLSKICESLNIIKSSFEKIVSEDEYLVFGSFLVVEKFLRNLGIYEK